MPMISEATPIAFSDPLPDAVDVVIIGAGVIGTSTAYFLAERGVKVLLCEKGRVAGEQSSRNWGWIRQQGRDRAELPIMMESNRIWRGLAEKTGEPELRFTESGCVNLAETPEALAKYEIWHDVAKEHQLDTQMLSSGEVRELCPNLKGNWLGGMITPSDGRGEPFVAVPALARAAHKLGATIIENCAVRTVETEAGRVSGVATELGHVKAGAVMLAGGAWSTYFAANAGLDLPQLTVRSTVGRTNEAPENQSPNTSLAGLAMRRRDDGGYTVTSADLVEHYVNARSFKYFTKFIKLMRASAKDVRLRLGPPKGYPGSWGSKTRWGGDEISPFEQMRVLNPDPSALVRDRVLERLPLRAPWLADVGLAEIWAGMIDVTPDAVPYLCEVPETPGMFLATGMSGHGFGIGPGVGRVMADLIGGGAPGYDLGRFRFGRFSDGSEIVPGPY
jgi:glycine/D-amino acid oxidase-like deaminating enzyme